MKSQFTPAPWRVKDDSIVGPLGNTIAECFGYSVRATSADQMRQGGREANAHLIASAPELLAALEAMTKAYVELVESDYAPCWNAENDKEVISARAIIAKAKGQQ